MAYAQWIYMIIHNMLKSGNLTVKQANVMWGKFYQWNNKDNDISDSEVEQQMAKPSGQMGIASCGRSDSSSGTEGSYDIYDGDAKVCHIYWSCPWGSQTNTFTVSEVDDNYMVQATDQNMDSGAIGTVNIKVAKSG